MARPRCFFDITAGGAPLGRITMELRADIVPKTVENFLGLCIAEKGSGYKGSKFIELSNPPCAKVVTTKIIMGQAAKASGVENLMMKTSNYSTMNRSLISKCMGNVQMIQSFKTIKTE